MPRVTLEEAQSLAEEFFPKGPEAIADALGVHVEYCSLTGTDGWCVQHKGTAPKIRINKGAVPARQRFTLAHEIAHLLLGTEPEIASNKLLPFEAVRKEERKADQLAAMLLIPLVHLKKLVANVVPVDAFTIKKLAERSSVSPMVAAGRIVAEAKELGLKNGALAVFKDAEYQWSWSPSLGPIASVAKKLMPQAIECQPKVFRTKPNAQGAVVTAAIVSTREYHVLVLQLLPATEASKKTHHEIARELDEALFAGDDSFRRQFSGALGFFRPIAAKTTLEIAVKAFSDRYSKRWSEEYGESLLSPKGQAYLRHRLSAWTLP